LTVQKRIKVNKEEVSSNQAMLVSLTEQQSARTQNRKKDNEATMKQRRSNSNPDRSERRQKKAIQTHNQALQKTLKQLKKSSKKIVDKIQVLKEEIAEDELKLRTGEIATGVIENHIDKMLLCYQEEMRKQMDQINKVVESGQ